MSLPDTLAHHAREAWDRWNRPNRTLRRFLNYLVSQVEQKVLQSPHMWARPTQAFVEVCSACNLRCPLCPTGQGIKTNTKGMLKFEDFKRIIDPLAPWMYEVHLYNWGEPLMNKDVFRITKYAHDKGLKTLISTNLNYLPIGMEDQMVLSGLDHLWVSADGATQENYEKYRVGGEIEIVEANIRRILQARKRQGLKTPVVEWRMLVMKHNEHEKPLVRRRGAALGVDKVTFEPVRVDTYKDVFTPVGQLIEENEDWLPQEDLRYDHATKTVRGGLSQCYQPWKWLTINYNGDVYPCCSAYDTKWKFDNLLQTPFSRVWNGETYRTARKIVSRKGHDRASGLICSHCQRYEIKNRQPYEGTLGTPKAARQPAQPAGAAR